MRRILPPRPITFSKRSKRLNNSVNTLLMSTRVRSLAATPATKLNPPLCPLLMLCLMMEKITGPMLMASNKPNAKPVMIASVMNESKVNINHELHE